MKPDSVPELKGLQSAEGRAIMEIYGFCLWCPGDEIFVCVWKEISLMVFWVNLFCVCAGFLVRGRIGACTCPCTYVTEFQSWCIWLTSLPGPLIFLMTLIPLLQGWRRPFSRQLNTLFGNCAHVEERWVLDGLHCLGICPRQKVGPILQKLADGDLALLQHKWLWSPARGRKAKNE